ncbi:lysine--tRNA ligase, partial [bacterium]|nr:lysine--tRNA ligase [bacterium]
KRLLVGGLERVFEINRNFRNEGISIQHNPEFTMLEFYQAYAVHTDLMDLTEELMRELVREVHGDDLTLPYAQETIDFSKPFPRLTMEEAVLAANDDLSEGDTRNRDKLAAICKRIGQEVKADWGWGKLLTVVFEETVEKSLRQPTFVHGFPVEVSPLARRNDKDPEIADRWEFFIVGREHANAFSELNDPDDQRERFEAQMKAKAGGDEEAQPFDADYIRALEYGMPPAAGCGIGIDRVVMLLTNQPSIRDVILFPHLRPESGRGE